MNFRLNLINNIIIHYYWRFYRLGFSTRNNIITEKKTNTFARTFVGSQFVAGRTLATETAGRVDAFAAATQARDAGAFIDIFPPKKERKFQMK